LNHFEISLVLVDDQKMRGLNKKHRGSDAITDVLSFNLGSGLGEIFISRERAKSQARACGRSFKRELATLFVHGLLHLLGHNDQGPKERREMFKLQDEVVDSLRIKD